MKLNLPRSAVLFIDEFDDSEQVVREEPPRSLSTSLGSADLDGGAANDAPSTAAGSRAQSSAGSATESGAGPRTQQRGL